MCFCLAQPVMLASLPSGEGCRSSAAIAGPGAARWALPTHEGLCTGCAANGAETAEPKGTLNTDFVPSW